MICPLGSDYDYDYKRSKKQYFEKYDRKVNAIISTIRNSSSINEKDKKKLIGKLANKLLSEIGR